MSSIPFTKMHGLGNDFVVLDARGGPIALSAEGARVLADRRRGVGCDQIIVMEPAPDGDADLFMRILNADGGEVEACGNGTRCVAHLLMTERGQDSATIRTGAGLLHCAAGPDGAITVDMGPAGLDWRDIPVAEQCDTLHLPVEVGPLRDPVGVSVGNPHAIFFVADPEAVALDRVGPEIEHHPFFPERTNVEVAAPIAQDRIRLRVWERGVGITRACGTGACATAVAAHRRGLSGRDVTIVLDGGELTIAWREDGHVAMTGPASISYSGQVAAGLLADGPATGE